MTNQPKEQQQKEQGQKQQGQQKDDAPRMPQKHEDAASPKRHDLNKDDKGQSHNR